MNASSVRDREAALILAMLDAPGLGPKRVLDALGRAGGAEAAWGQLLADGVPTVREALSSSDLAVHERVVASTHALGGDFKLWDDADYPANLSKWSARPPVLFFKGRLDALTPRALALVGRVDPSEQGIDAATRFARLCVENEINVISGLAKGIDGASHRGALLDPPGNTYAVVAHGLDFAYPSENADLYAAIPNHGAVLSQFATGIGPQRWTFPARNEAMCTLALGTVIIEAKEGCGSIIQADFSFKHGRPVFILSRNLKTGDTDWADKLVKKGAHVIEHFEQVTSVVEQTMGDLWGEKQVQGTFFDLGPGGVTGELVKDVDMTAPRAALFDLDGVVVTTMATERKAIAEVASHLLGREVDPGSVPGGSGSPFSKLAGLGVQDAWASATKAKYQAAWERLLTHAEVVQEVVAVITQMRTDGWRLGAITSNTRQRAERMVPAEVRALFDIFVTYGDGGKDKASAIGRMLREWEVPVSRAFYIGDQLKDVDAAHQAGVLGVGVLWGVSTLDELEPSAPDVILENPSQAERLLALIA